MEPHRNLNKFTILSFKKYWLPAWDQLAHDPLSIIFLRQVNLSSAEETTEHFLTQVRMSH